MNHFKGCLAFAAAVALAFNAIPAAAQPVKNIVLVHGHGSTRRGGSPCTRS